jgi:hypothetical protein
MFNSWLSKAPVAGVLNSDEYHWNRRWVLGVFQRNVSVPTWWDFKQATYFGCPEDQQRINHREIQHWQGIGSIDVDIDHIRPIGRASHALDFVL